MTEKQGVREHARMKWNDIRRIGPLLVVALAAVVMINPSSVGNNRSVGAGVDLCAPDVAGVSLDDPCYEDPCRFYNEVAVIIAGPDGECCVEETALVGASFPPCADPEPLVETAPAIDYPPAPDPIVGPIWLGAIKADASIPGLVKLTFPDLLAVFIGDNVVTVYDADDEVAFEGHISADGTILVFSDNAPMLVKTRLITFAPYSETVGASSS